MELTEYLEKHLSESSTKGYLYEIGKFRKHYKNPEKIKYQDVMDYVELVRKNNNPQSTNRILQAVKKYFEYLQETGKIKHNPAKSVRIKDGKENPIQL